MKKVNPIKLIISTCGMSVLVMIIMHALLAAARITTMKYVLNNVETLPVMVLVYFFATELVLEVGARYFANHKYISFTRLIGVLTKELTRLDVNWRSHYTTGDLEKLFEYVNSIAKTVEYTIMVVQKLSELLYAAYLVTTKGAGFIGVLGMYVGWTVVFEVLLMVYLYNPNTKKRLELAETRNRLSNDQVLNLNLMGMYSDAAKAIVAEVERLNKEITRCCFINSGITIISIVVGYVAYDATMLYMFQSVSPIEKVRIFTLLATVCEPIFWLLDLIPDIIDNQVKFKKVSAIINQKPDVIDGKMELDGLAEDYTIEFQHVSFSYDKKSQVLRDVNFIIHKGERVAFVGESGCGKSTLIKLLTRQIEPTSGTIMIDGIDIRTYTLESLRKVFGVISQDVEIMADSLEFNIAMAVLPRKATREEVLSCCKAALRNKVEQLAEGLDTFVGDRGIKLSGGLKQLIALARILISKREVLVLDEATAALDNISEVEVLNAIEEELPNRTMIAVAHRLSTVRDYDVIHVIKNGGIVESGSYEELVDKQGVFSTMLDAAINKSRRVRRTKH